MTWIATIAYDEARGALRKLYDRIKGPDNNIDNIMLAHSLRPHSMQGHMALYKSVLHHRGNALEKSYLETIGVYVSMLNRCQYCVDHHCAGLSRLLSDDVRVAEIRHALLDGNPAAAFTGKDLAGLEYAQRLTVGAAPYQNRRSRRFEPQVLMMARYWRSTRLRPTSPMPTARFLAWASNRRAILSACRPAIAAIQTTGAIDSNAANQARQESSLQWRAATISCNAQQVLNFHVAKTQQTDSKSVKFVADEL